MHYKPFSYTRLGVYICFALAMLFLQCVGENFEPLALALVYAMPLSGLSPLVASLSAHVQATGVVRTHRFALHGKPRPPLGIAFVAAYSPWLGLDFAANQSTVPGKPGSQRKGHGPAYRKPAGWVF